MDNGSKETLQGTNGHTKSKPQKGTKMLSHSIHQQHLCMLGNNATATLYYAILVIQQSFILLITKIKDLIVNLFSNIFK